MNTNSPKLLLTILLSLCLSNCGDEETTTQTQPDAAPTETATPAAESPATPPAPAVEEPAPAPEPTPEERYNNGEA
ncbi:MAG: hypothetical protein IJO34_05985, partial [Akkermansia sp.]|nr:hypothetical protein [Akkermansia sp.]